MRSSHVWIISAGAGGRHRHCQCRRGPLGGRYTIITIAGNNVAWKLDRITGQAYGCEESEFGAFCIPAPDRIKHTQ